MLPNFVAKVTIDRRACIRLNGKLVLEDFAMLRARLIGSASREAAALFAEPVLTAKGTAVEVVWYSEQAGEPVPLDTLDPDVRQIVAGKLKRRLAAIAPLLGSDLGPLLGRALYLESPAAILALGQEPVLINWGILPAEVAAGDQAALDRHFAATLGSFAAFGAPRIAAPAAGVPATGAPAASASAAGIFATPPIAARPPSRTGLLVGIAAAALLAALLAVPGVVDRHSNFAGPDADALEQVKTITKAMQEKTDQAKAALDAAHCDSSGAITVPNKVGQGALPPPIQQDPGQQQGDLSLVARRATESVVFIFTCTDRQSWDEEHKDDKDKGTPFACPDPSGSGAADLVFSASGSGFFIAPFTIATNTHVVEGAKAIFVTNRFLGKVAKATVKAATVKQRVDDPDFAVVGITAERSPPPIELVDTASRLQNVVAAGYPGVIIHEDAELERLLKGDDTAAPELTTFPGFITLTMNQNGSVPLIFSSAVIGHGNSGGPLLDLCARAIGVNTLGWSGVAEDTGFKVNVAEGAKALNAFLDTHKIDHKTADTSCAPGPQAGNPPPPSAVPPSAVPPAPAITPVAATPPAVVPPTAVPPPAVPPAAPAPAAPAPPTSTGK